MSTVLGAKKLEELLRDVASLSVDKSDVKRLLDLLSSKLYDLLVVAARNATYNGRDIVMEPDLPITKGLQESIRQFRVLEQQIELQPILDFVASQAPLERPLSEDVEQKLPEIVGALVLVIARLLKVIDPTVKNPNTSHWDRVEEALNLTL